MTIDRAGQLTTGSFTPHTTFERWWRKYPYYRSDYEDTPINYDDLFSVAKAFGVSTDEIQALLGLNDKERAQILSINLSNAPGRKYKEVWIGLGGAQSAVYATEVSPEEYYCYTTEETEKLELQRLTEKLDGNIELAIKQLAESKRSK